jgi:hypothetical protein
MGCLCGIQPLADRENCTLGRAKLDTLLLARVDHHNAGLAPWAHRIEKLSVTWKLSIWATRSRKETVDAILFAI